MCIHCIEVRERGLRVILGSGKSPVVLIDDLLFRANLSMSITAQRYIGGGSEIKGVFLRVESFIQTRKEANSKIANGTIKDARAGVVVAARVLVRPVVMMIPVVVAGRAVVVVVAAAGAVTTVVVVDPVTGEAVVVVVRAMVDVLDAVVEETGAEVAVVVTGAIDVDVEAEVVVLVVDLSGYSMLYRVTLSFDVRKELTE